MSNGIDIYTLIFAALAIFLFFKLRGLLGTKTGEENTQNKLQEVKPQDNVINFPSTGAPIVTPFRWAGFCVADSDMAKAFDAIALKEPNFSPLEFITGAKAAYEMFTTSFAKGDRNALKAHLSSDVMAGFEGVMAAREKQGHRQEFKFVGIDRAEIVDAHINEQEQEFEIAVNFRGQAISATYDANNNLVDGLADRVTDMKDIWTFARKINAKDPNWTLVGTQDVD